MEGAYMTTKKRYPAQQLRRCVWRSFTIMRTVIILDLVAVIDGISYDTARKILRQLEIHGYVAKTGLWRGSHRLYAKSRQVPLLPAVCEICGAPFETASCDPSFREKEKEREREKEQALREEQGRERPADMADRVQEMHPYPRLAPGPAEPRQIPQDVKEKVERHLK